MYSNEYSQAPDAHGNLNNFIDLRDPESHIEDIPHEDLSDSLDDVNDFN